MNITNPLELDRLPLSPRFLCPYLGKHYDAETYSAVRDLPNYCHKADPNSPVSIEHQVLACTSEDFKDCAVFLSLKPTVLPAEWLNVEAASEGKQVSRRWLTARTLTYIGIGLVALIILGIVYQGWFSGSASYLPVAQASSTSMLTRTALVTPSLTLSPTIPPSATPVFTATPNHTQTQQAVDQIQTATAAAVQASQAVIGPVETQTPSATLTNCTLHIFDPTYSPGIFQPAVVMIYGAQPFLIKWKVVNTSSDCAWNSMQLLTDVKGEPKMLVMMPDSRVQPMVDAEFVIRDENYTAVNRVEPGQTVTIVIQINGLDLVKSSGKIDRFFDMIINGELIPDGKLIAVEDKWAVVIIPTRAPTKTITPPNSPPHVNPSSTSSPTIPPPP